MKIKKEKGENYGGWKVGEREKMKKGLFFSYYSYLLRKVGLHNVETFHTKMLSLFSIIPYSYIFLYVLRLIEFKVY